MKRLYALLLPLILFALACPASAQVQQPQKQAQTDYIAQLTSFNSTNPSNNPAYERPEQFMHRNVLDSAKQVIGDSRDLVIGANGQVQQIAVNVDRIKGLGRSGQVLYFDYNGVTRQNVSRALQLPVQADQILANMPDYLNAAATAAGNGGGTFALSHVRDAELRYGDGQMMGKVREALLNDSGSQIEALVPDNIRGAGASRKIALPYDPDKIKIGENNGKLVFYLQKPFDEAFVKYAHGAR